MPYTLNIAGVINYTVATYKYGVRTLQGRHRCANM